MKQKLFTLILPLVFLLVVAARLSATYTTAKFQGKPDVMGDGNIRALVLVTGDAGEPDTWLPPIYGKTLTDIQVQVKSAVDALNAGRKDAKDIAPGTTIDAPPAPSKQPDPPPPSAQQQFTMDLARWSRVNAAIQSGILTGSEPEVAALKSQVKSEYQASYLPTF